MSDKRTIKICDAKYAIVYHELGIEEETVAFFAEDRRKIVMNNLKQGVLNVCKNGEESKDLILSQYKIFKEITPAMRFTTDRVPQKKEAEYPKTECPKCHEWVEDMDGFGVLAHKDCGYCSHPSSTMGVCDICHKW